VSSHSKKWRHGKALINRDDVINSQYGKCAVCGWGAFEDWYNIQRKPIGKQGKACLSNGLDVHHIVSVKDGGTDDFKNLIGLCGNCHYLADFGVYSIKYLIEAKSKVRTQEQLYFEHIDIMTKYIQDGIK